MDQLPRQRERVCVPGAAPREQDAQLHGVGGAPARARRHGGVPRLHVVCRGLVIGVGLQLQLRPGRSAGARSDAKQGHASTPHMRLWTLHASNYARLQGTAGRGKAGPASALP